METIFRVGTVLSVVEEAVTGFPIGEEVKIHSVGDGTYFLNKNNETLLHCFKENELKDYFKVVRTPTSDTLYKDIDTLCEEIHQQNVEAGWWTDQETSILLKDAWYSKYVYATKLSLIHSETSEMLEGLRKGTMDDHLPERTTEEAEAADILIRLLDYCGARGIKLGSIMEEKAMYNKSRSDHKPENRKKKGGKLF